MSPRAGLWLALLIPFSAAGESEETLLGCRATESAEERLACYDRVVDRARESITPGALSGAPRASSSVPAEAADAGLQEALFGRPPAASAETFRKSYGVKAASEISSVVHAVQRGGDRLLQITLENEQVWRQVDLESFSARVGDAVEIKAGALGSYYLRRVGQGRTTRVKRVR